MTKKNEDSESGPCPVSRDEPPVLSQKLVGVPPSKQPTPGPWCVTRDGYAIEQSSEDPFDDREPRYIGHAERRADARVFAASPEMLVIVEAVASADTFDTIGSIKVDVPGQDRAWLKAAAIALLARIEDAEVRR